MKKYLLHLIPTWEEHERLVGLNWQIETTKEMKKYLLHLIPTWEVHERLVGLNWQIETTKETMGNTIAEGEEDCIDDNDNGTKEGMVDISEVDEPGSELFMNRGLTSNTSQRNHTESNEVKKSNGVNGKSIVECTECGKSFHDNMSISSNRRKAHFPCGKCDNIFQKSSGLAFHVTKLPDCYVKLEKIDAISFLAEKSEVYNWQQSLKCGVSDHVRCAKRFHCKTCGKGFSKYCRLTRHQIVHSDDRPFSCLSCGKRFKEKDVMKEHMKIHSDKKEYECNICFRSFLTRRYLTAHMRFHSTERKHFCEQCGKGFVTSCHLKRHLRIHKFENGLLSENELYPCDTCGKKLRTKDSLRAHMVIHHDRKRYTCTICFKGFYWNGSLTRHMQHHSESRERKYSCDKCVKSFFTKTHLKRHSLSHMVVADKMPELYRCEICDKSYRRRESFRNHMATHKGEKSHECMICFKAFFSQDGLRWHIRGVHVRKREHSCENCAKKFLSRAHLRRHLLIHNPGNKVEKSRKNVHPK